MASETLSPLMSDIAKAGLDKATSAMATKHRLSVFPKPSEPIRVICNILIPFCQTCWLSIQRAKKLTRKANDLKDSFTFNLTIPRCLLRGSLFPLDTMKNSYQFGLYLAVTFQRMDTAMNTTILAMLFMFIPFIPPIILTFQQALFMDLQTKIQLTSVCADELSETVSMLVHRLSVRYITLFLCGA